MIGQHAHGRLQHIEPDIQKICILHTIRRRQHAPSLDLALLHIRQVDGNPLSCIALFPVLAMHLDASYLAFLPNRIHFQQIILGNGPRHQSSRNDRPKAGQCKRAVNWKSWYSANIFCHHLIACHLADGIDQDFQAFPGGSRYFYYRRMFQKGSFQFFLDFFFYQFHPFPIHKVAFVQDDDTLLNSQQIQDIHMLPGLWHDAFVRGNDQQNHIHTYHACHHIIDESFMARNIYDAGTVSAWQVKIGKSQINGNSPSLLLFPPVRIPPGQRLD